MKQWIESFFFANFFYAVCAIALTIEACLQQNINVPSIAYFITISALVVLFYTIAYNIETLKQHHNPRANWYRAHHRFSKRSQYVLALCSVAGLIYLLFQIPDILHPIHINSIILLLLLLLIPLFYYGEEQLPFARFSLRKIGWLKPFLIGFVWASTVTLLPVIWNHLQQQTALSWSSINLRLCLHNMMFVAVLSIMFDIKDYAADGNHQLKTFVVQFGLRKTIFWILMPLCLLGFISYVSFAMRHQLLDYNIILNAFPLICLIFVAYQMHRRRNIIYYLILIDGLMVIKGISGSIASLYF